MENKKKKQYEQKLNTRGVNIYTEREKMKEKKKLKIIMKMGFIRNKERIFL